MDPAGRLNSEALLKHAYMDLQGKQAQYTSIELRPVPGAGGDGHWTAAGTTTTKRKEWGPSFVLTNKRLGAMGQSFSTQRRKPGVAMMTTPAVNNAVVGQAQPSQPHLQSQPETPFRTQVPTTSQNDSGPSQNTHAPAQICFANNANRNNWFGSGIVGQGFHHVSCESHSLSYQINVVMSEQNEHQHWAQVMPIYINCLICHVG